MNAQRCWQLLSRESSSIVRVMLRPKQKSNEYLAVNDPVGLGPLASYPEVIMLRGACCQKQNKAVCIARQVSRLLITQE